MPPVFSQDLTPFNTLGLRVQADAVVDYTSTQQLEQLSELASGYERVLVLGGGSNVVLAPHLSGLVIKVRSTGVRVVSQTDDELIIEAQAGEVWHDFVAWCVKNGWNGLENLALIPGTVGAAPVQNIGAYGVELDQRFHSLIAWDLQERRQVRFSAADCQFAYRDSFFKRAQAGRWLIVAVQFRLPRPWRPVLSYPDLQQHPMLEPGLVTQTAAHSSAAFVTAEQIFNAVCDIRRRKLPDPLVLGNAGSFFKNPIVACNTFDALKVLHPALVGYVQEDGSYKLAAGWLIDQAGWKGRRRGAVGVHDRQALVLVNHGGATAHDIVVLADEIRADVSARFGVMLEQEPVAVS